MGGVLADIHDARNKFQSALEVGGADLRLLSLAAWIQAARATKLMVRGIPRLRWLKVRLPPVQSRDVQSPPGATGARGRFRLPNGSGLDPCVSGDPGIQCPMGTQAQGGEQVWIADQDQSESRLLGQVESQSIRISSKALMA
jgi:hypothetical protein